MMARLYVLESVTRSSDQRSVHRHLIVAEQNPYCPPNSHEPLQGLLPATGLRDLGSGVRATTLGDGINGINWGLPSKPPLETQNLQHGSDVVTLNTFCPRNCCLGGRRESWSLLLHRLPWCHCSTKSSYNAVITRQITPLKIGRRICIDIFFQRKHTSGWRAHEKMLEMTISHPENSHQNRNERQLHTH